MTSNQIEAIINSSQFADDHFEYYATEIYDWEEDGEVVHVYYRDEDGKHQISFYPASYA